MSPLKGFLLSTQVKTFCRFRTTFFEAIQRGLHLSVLGSTIWRTEKHFFVVLPKFALVKALWRKATTKQDFFQKKKIVCCHLFHVSGIAKSGRIGFGIEFLFSLAAFFLGLLTIVDGSAKKVSAL